MAKPKKDDPTVRTLLATPPQPHATARLPEHFYVIEGGRILVAAGKKPPGPTFVADLYRNLADLQAGRIAEPGVRLEVGG